ncbi:arrestin [Patellaria atrata CBS 101060]|uniref:Arrestin n=1 Tax=Patellaria atrata CBS 101060 TaxID=1346257 RepID=A0A9P4SBJ3_9PEZI|nr:arrestin [Patellaria atrata CBS 101060]
MNVTIVLDRPHSHFTNIDFISGRVYLRVSNNANISSIVVKLEGESKTRLLAPSRPGYNDRAKPVLEVHKLLYKVNCVFPPFQGNGNAPPLGTSYTLTAGNYEYPFQFKLPINNACNTANSLSTNLNFAGLQVEVAKTPTRHVKQTLPPSLSGFPGEAEIKYYVKVTVNRPSLLKENPRAFAPFNFLPIEPPRPPKADGEAYARRQHQFRPSISEPSASKKVEKWFSRKSSTDSATTPAGTPAATPISPMESKMPLARFSVDARLPNPSILTCNEEIPLRILVKQLSERDENVYLQMVQIEIIGYTKIVAHDVVRTETNGWVVLSMSNMAIPLGSPTDPVGTEVSINREYWAGKTLPNTIAPSFQTCNISRYYELEVRVGLGYGSYQHGKDQLIVLPLRLPVKIFSGIAPPPALLERMLNAASQEPVLPPRPNSHAGFPHSPIDSPGAHQYPSPQQGQYLAPAGPSIAQPYQGSAPHSGAAPGYDDAPPSYEDAIASDMPPIDGPRRDYAPPPPAEGASTFAIDQKR